MDLQVQHVSISASQLLVSVHCMHVCILLHVFNLFLRVISLKFRHKPRPRSVLDTIFVSVVSSRYPTNHCFVLIHTVWHQMKPVKAKLINNVLCYNRTENSHIVTGWPNIAGMKLDLLTAPSNQRWFCSASCLFVSTICSVQQGCVWSLLHYQPWNCC